MPKQSGRWRAQLLVQAARRAPLHKLLDRLIAALDDDRATAKLRWSVDVDPIDLY